jgi:hypothetical protein
MPLPVAEVLTATVAFVTVKVSVLGLVTLPTQIVEPVIALSIAYVAFENLTMKSVVSRRWAVSFVFGLVHGIGFAGALAEVGLPASGLAARSSVSTSASRQGRHGHWRIVATYHMAAEVPMGAAAHESFVDCHNGGRACTAG